MEKKFYNLGPGHCLALMYIVQFSGHVMNQMQRRMDAVFDDVIPVQFWESDFMLSRRKG